jgi:hypothetical protein
MRLGVACLGLVVFAACGGRVEEEGEESAEAIALFTRGERACAEAADPRGAAAALRPQTSSGEGVAVVELALVSECTGAGGDYVLARALDEARREFWLGAHACQTWSFSEPPLPNGSFGVVRFTETAALFSTPEGACVAFPGGRGGEPLRSSAIVEAVAAFSSRDAAERARR